MCTCGACGLLFSFLLNVGLWFHVVLVTVETAFITSTRTKYTNNAYMRTGKWSPVEEQRISSCNDNSNKPGSERPQITYILFFSFHVWLHPRNLGYSYHICYHMPYTLYIVMNSLYNSFRHLAANKRSNLNSKYTLHTN